MKPIERIPMSHLTIVNRSQLFAAATAITAVGFLTVPTPAQAGPTLPLAPPCNQYGFNGDFRIRQDNGWQVLFNSTGPGAGTGSVVAVNNDNVGKLTGGVGGGGINGRNVDFNVNWAGVGRGHYTGTVGDDGLVHRGVYVDQSSGQSVNWDSTIPLGCSTPTAPVVLTPGATDPPPHQVGPQAPIVPGATVTNDVDVYDVPGGNGQIIGILRSGRQVKFATANGLPAAPGQTCKPQDWCHVVIPELPGGSGWVWDEFLKF
jgi:hypothetical protein